MLNLAGLGNLVRAVFEPDFPLYAFDCRFVDVDLDVLPVVFDLDLDPDLDREGLTGLGSRTAVFDVDLEFPCPYLS